MHNVHQRFLDICTVGVMALLVTAVLTAATTIVRDAVLRPRPAFSGLRVDASSVVEATDRTLLYPMGTFATLTEGAAAAAAGNFSNFRSHYLTSADGSLDDNVHVNPHMTSLLRQDERQPQRRYQSVPAGTIVADRTFRRMVLKVNGRLDVSKNWDWNTKSIYVSFIARFGSAAAARDVQSEVIFLDCMVRRAPDPPARVAALFTRLHQYYARAAQALGGGRVDLTQVWSPAEKAQYEEYHAQLPHQEHDHPSVLVDHARRVLYFNESFKYYVDDFDGHQLVTERSLEVLVRYQVMSYSGWAPVREERLGAASVVFVPAESLDRRWHSVGGGQQQGQQGGGGSQPQVRVREANMQAPSATVQGDL